MHDPMTFVFGWPTYKFRIRVAALTNGRLHPKDIIDIWHHDPSDYDSDTCGMNYNKLSHIKHWEFRFLPWIRLMKRIFQRCAYCGAPSSKKNPVNHSLGGWDDTKYPLWYSRPKMYHQTCMERRNVNHKSIGNNCRREGYIRGYKDGRFELADGTGFMIPKDWMS